MRIVLPYVAGRLNARAVAALERSERPFQVAALEITEPHAYRRLLEHLFRTMTTALVLVEHDVEIRTGVLDGFDNCPLPWCYHAYPMRVPYDEAVGGDTGFAPFGCTRFRPEIQPLLKWIGGDPDWLGCPDHTGLDRALSAYLNRWGYKPHRHRGEVFHHHDYSSEGP